MRLVIFGSRTLRNDPDNHLLIGDALVALGIDEQSISEVVSGDAVGVDRSGEAWAFKRNIPIKVFWPDWNGPDKRAAGMVRNAQMADYAQIGIGIWDGKSPGTKAMFEMMVERGKPVWMYSTKTQTALWQRL